MRKLTYETMADGRKKAVLVNVPKKPLTEKEIERRNKRMAHFGIKTKQGEEEEE